VHALIQLDHRLFWLVNHSHNRALDYLMLGASSLGEYAAVWWVAAVILFMANKGNSRQIAVLMASAILLSFFIDDALIKHWWFRERPYLALEGVHRLGKFWTNGSFPSGHASSVVAVSMVLGTYCHRLIVPTVIFTLLTFYSRPYLGMHYPLDVLVGAVSGLLAGWIVLRVGRRLFGPVQKPTADETQPAVD